MSEPPFEPPDGQDDPPELLLFLYAVARLLRDLREKADEDERLRISALLAVLARIRDREEGHDRAVR